MGAAARFAADLSPLEYVRQLRDRLETEILESIPDAYVNGDRGHRLPNTTNISFDGLNGEMLLHKLDRAGICVSTGSACHSGSHTSSPVLQAMNIPYSRALGSIRFSLGRHNTTAEINDVIDVMKQVVGDLREWS
jgi:cysteine desulfurase